MIASTRLRSSPLQGQARRAHPFAAFAGHVVGQLDVLDQLHRGIEMQKRHEPAVERQRLVDLARLRKPEKLHGLVREAVRHARDPADGAEQDVLQHQIVDAAEQRVAVAQPVDHVGDPAAVVAQFLDRHDVLLAGQFGEVLGREVHLVGHAVVVDHDRQIDGPGQRAEMGDRLARVLLVDHAGQRHETSGAGGLHPARAVDGEIGGVFGHAGQHRNPPGRRLDRGADHAFLLVNGERAVLAQRAQHHEALAARRHAGVDVPSGRVQVEFATLAHLGHQGGDHPLPVSCHDLHPFASSCPRARGGRACPSAAQRGAGHVS